MPLVLVHGNPETPAVWDRLITELERDDVVALWLPGFGSPTPPMFEATMDEYATWLTEAVASLEGPVDLVGHDWGGALVMRVVSTRPEIARSWVSDVAGLFDPDYEWHEFARVWQRAGDGERAIAETLDRPRDMQIDLLVSGGITPAEAAIFTDAFDVEMGRCILGLYRSAAQPAMLEWGRDAPTAAASRGLVLAPSEDPFTGGIDMAHRAARNFGADFEVLDGLGHWWMLQDPSRAARLLERFWAAA